MGMLDSGALNTLEFHTYAKYTNQLLGETYERHYSLSRCIRTHSRKLWIIQHFQTVLAHSEVSNNHSHLKNTSITQQIH